MRRSAFQDSVQREDDEITDISIKDQAAEKPKGRNVPIEQSQSLTHKSRLIRYGGHQKICHKFKSSGVLLIETGNFASQGNTGAAIK